MLNFLKTAIGQWVLAFVAGAVLVAAFAPLRWFWLSVPTIALLFYQHYRLAPAKAFKLGFAFGLGFYLAGISWVYVSLHVYGGMPVWMGSLAVLLFASVMALFVALPCWLVAFLLHSDNSANYQSRRLLLLIATWLVFEWIKSWLLSGFPWLDLGYSQTDSLLFALAPVGGVYLLSFCVLLAAATLILWLQGNARRGQKGLALGSVALLFVVAAIYSDHRWSEPTSTPLTVAIAQPNTPITEKWQANFRQGVVENLLLLSEDAQNQIGAKPDLVVWPETALPLYYQQILPQFWASLTNIGDAVLTGLVDSEDREHSYNAAVLLCGAETQIYRKRHLVPFGEFLPFRAALGWLLDYLKIPMSDFSAWQGVQSLACADGPKIGLSICYEDAFAGEQRIYNRDAELLVNISEDAWFGDSLAPHQRLQMAQMRARELARPMLRSGNSGPSAVIDANGQIVASSAQFIATTIVAEVQPRAGATPYQRYGNWIVWLALLLLLIEALGAVRRARR